ncbi:MAG: MmcB family DNA repair protein [Alphaproteobacteria bacterium]|nr:MmcB family DNA repair protein [Alphaproteobacteria bacterium]
MTFRANNPLGPAENPPDDGRQSEAANDIARGITRILRAYGLVALREVTLPNGRRADVLGLSDKGELWIMEIKSSVADFRADNKWRDYQEFCDRFFFAVAPDFPVEILPAETGLVLADRFGGEIGRRAEQVPLPAARRKALTLLFARTAAARLSYLHDPDLVSRIDAFKA